MDERAHECNEHQRRHDDRGYGGVFNGSVQEPGAAVETRDVGLERCARLVVVGDLIQLLRSIDDLPQSCKQERNERGDGAEQKGWRGDLSDDPRQFGRCGGIEEHSVTI